MDQWDKLLEDLDRYDCDCGSGGPWACDDDCRGEKSDKRARETLKVVIEALRHHIQEKL